MDDEKERIEKLKEQMRHQRIEFFPEAETMSKELLAFLSTRVSVKERNLYEGHDYDACRYALMMKIGGEKPKLKWYQKVWKKIARFLGGTQ